MASPTSFALGSGRDLRRPALGGPMYLPAKHLTTHGVVLGMTGSGKTGLVLVLAEEALRNRVPVLLIDVKGDLPNLLVTPSAFGEAALAPFAPALLDERAATRPSGALAALAAARAAGLARAGIDAAAIDDFVAKTRLRVITPGSSAGESLHLVSMLERRSERWDTDPESARASLGAAISHVLRLLGRESDAARSREHVLLMLLAERRHVAKQPADLANLIEDVRTPPFERVGALDIDEFMPKHERRELAASLNGLLVAPSFAAWREGATLDIASWLEPTPDDPRTPGVVLSVAHLGDDERAHVLSIVFEELLAWTRSLPGTQRLRAMVLIDEASGLLPPHPHSPPTKAPLVAMLKQGRAFGVGLVIATQNPMDLDYRALGNAGLWCIGRLQTDADRTRVVEGLLGSVAKVRDTKQELNASVRGLAPREFLVRDAHASEGLAKLTPRFAMSLMLGPMTRADLRRAVVARSGVRSTTASARAGDEEVECAGERPGVRGLGG